VPRDADTRIASLAAKQAGRVARRQLLAAGISGRSIDRRIESRRLQSTLPGVYAVGPVSTWLSRPWEAYLFAGPDSDLSFRAAAVIHRLGEFAALDVTLAAKRRGTQGLVCHRATIAPRERMTKHGLPVTTPARTLLDLCSILPEPRMKPVFRQAEVLALIDQASIRALLAAHCRAKGAPLLRRLAGIEAGHIRRGRMRSPIEIDFRNFAEHHSLPALEFNVRLAVGDRFYEVDAVWREQRVIVELDARSTHGGAAFEEDRERDRHLTAHGWRVIRVTGAQLARPEELLADLRLLLGLASAV
jgi:very-short-patch-repair endonuclease